MTKPRIQRDKAPLSLGHIGGPLATLKNKTPLLQRIFGGSEICTILLVSRSTNFLFPLWLDLALCASWRDGALSDRTRWRMRYATPGNITALSSKSLFARGVARDFPTNILRCVTCLNAEGRDPSLGLAISHSFARSARKHFQPSRDSVNISVIAIPLSGTVRDCLRPQDQLPPEYRLSVEALPVGSRKKSTLCWKWRCSLPAFEQLQN